MTVDTPYLITATQDGQTHKCVIIVREEGFELANAIADNCQFLSSSAGRSLLIGQNALTQ